MQSDRYAVIGNPVAHSKSPEIHTSFASQTGQHLDYERLLAPLDGFAETVRVFMQHGGRGANVTVPFKLEAYALSHVLTDRAQAAGAVNTLSFNAGRIVGDNTDGVGLVTDIVKNAGIALTGKRVLLLGAGGAARGVLLPLLSEMPAQLVIDNRTKSKAHELAARFPNLSDQLQAREFSELNGTFDIIINATSSGLSGDMPAIPASLFNAQTFAYDMMYGAQPTEFLRLAASRGSAVRDGLGMLVEQAAESFFVWRGVRPDTAPVYARLRSSL